MELKADKIYIHDKVGCCFVEKIYVCLTHNININTFCIQTEFIHIGLSLFIIPITWRKSRWNKYSPELEVTPVRRAVGEKVMIQPIHEQNVINHTSWSRNKEGRKRLRLYIYQDWLNIFWNKNQKMSSRSFSKHLQSLWFQTKKLKQIWKDHLQE